MYLREFFRETKSGLLVFFIGLLLHNLFNRFVEDVVLHNILTIVVLVFLIASVILMYRGTVRLDRRMKGNTDGRKVFKELFSIN